MRRQLHAVLRVRGQDQRAEHGREFLVRVRLAAGVLAEILRAADLADVVQIASDAGEQGIRADLRRSRFRHVADERAVVIGPGRLHRELPEQRLVLVGPFAQPQVRRHVEELLDVRERGSHHGAGQHAAPERGDRFLDRQAQVAPERLALRRANAPHDPDSGQLHQPGQDAGLEDMRSAVSAAAPRKPPRSRPAAAAR